MRIAWLVFLIVTLHCNDANAQAGQVGIQYGPDFRQLIARQLQFDFDSTLAGTFVVDSDDSSDSTEPRNFFVDPGSLVPIEISKSRPIMHHTKGFAWLTCLQVHPAGKTPKYLSVFIIDKFVVDVRTAVNTDNCPEQTYEPLRWTPHESRQPPPR